MQCLGPTPTLIRAWEGVKVGGVLIPAIRFAVDQAMVSHTVRGLQVIMDALQDTSENAYEVEAGTV